LYNLSALKVFHGADSDIEWLQRDFGIYVVNLFDTGQASRVLSFAHFSLAFLLKHYCKVDVDKQFQLADWRIRPLPEQMILYAREDTHYLLYVYDCMKNELLSKSNAEKNLLLSVFQRSKVVCEKRYIKPIFKPDNYLELSKKSRKVFNSRQLYALRELYAWRDKIARNEDESTGYVMPNHMLLQIAEVLPREMQGILACCNPVPTLVRQNLNEVHQIILRARDQSLVKPIMQELQIQADESQQIDVDNILHCPHDFSHLKDMGTIDTGPTLLDMWNELGDKLEEELANQCPSRIPLKKTASLSAFESSSIEQNSNEDFEKARLVFQSYNSPFERYKLVHPMFGKVASDGITEEKSKVDTVDYIEGIKDHFNQLMQIHGNNLPEQSQMDSLPSGSTQSTPVMQSGASATEASIAEENSEDEIEMEEPLRKKVANARKKRRNKKSKQKQKAGNFTATSETVQEDPIPKMPKYEIDEAHFKPFDYSQTDSTVFQDGSDNGPDKKIKGKKHFNPNKSTQQFKRARQSKTNMKGKVNSLTYSSQKQNQNSKSATQWPQR